jgi:hypothetical protein
MLAHKKYPTLDVPRSCGHLEAAVDRTKFKLPQAACRVILTEQGDLAWVESTDDKPIIYTKEPKTSWDRRFKVGLYGILPI